jgi:hypothetical protein
MSSGDDLDNKCIDPLMMELFDKLPASGSKWPLDERMLWLSACEAVINLLYGPADRVALPAFLDKEASNADPAPANNETKEPEKTEPKEPEKAIEPSSNGYPSKTRPEGLPSNLSMATEAITALGGKASSIQIRDWLRKKYWAGMSESWTSCLWGFSSAGTLARDGINFTLPKSAAEKMDAAAVDVLKTNPGVIKAIVERESVRVPAPGKKLGPPARGPYTAIFTHGDRECVLQSSREYVLAGKLLKAMGKGHLSEAFLANAVMSSNTEDTRSTVRSVCLGMNEALAGVGLHIEFYAGFGLVMKEIDVG